LKAFHVPPLYLRLIESLMTHPACNRADAGSVIKFHESSQLCRDRKNQIYRHFQCLCAAACLRPGGLLVVDNVLSHPDEVAPFLLLIEGEPALTATVVPVGKGELLAVKAVQEGE